MNEPILVDSNIWHYAEVIAKADHPKATNADVRKLAEAWQRAYEEWAHYETCKHCGADITQDADGNWAKFVGPGQWQITCRPRGRKRHEPVVRT